jgi:hypothetical protein
MYIVWKKFPRCQGYIKRLDFIYYNNIILYISDNTYVLPIPPMNTTHTTLKKRWYKINLNRRILHIGPFILHKVLFNRWYRVVLCTEKNLTTEGVEFSEPLRSLDHTRRNPVR